MPVSVYGLAYTKHTVHSSLHCENFPVPELPYRTHPFSDGVEAELVKLWVFLVLIRGPRAELGGSCYHCGFGGVSYCIPSRMVLVWLVYFRIRGHRGGIEHYFYFSYLVFGQFSSFGILYSPLGLVAYARKLIFLSIKPKILYSHLIFGECSRFVS